MGADNQCCKPTNTEEELNEIFSGLPEDNQIPQLYVPNQTDEGKPPKSTDISALGYEYESSIPGNTDPRPTVIRDIPYKKDELNPTVLRSAKPRGTFDLPQEYPLHNNNLSYPLDENGDVNNNNFLSYYKNNNDNNNLKTSSPYKSGNYNNDNNFHIEENINTNFNNNMPIPEDEPEEELDEAENLIRKFASNDGAVRSNDDFNPDGWKELYPEEADFFIWNKDNLPTLAGQTKIDNPNDYNRAEVYRGEINPENGMRHGFGEAWNREGSRIGTWRNDQFTGWGRETKRGQTGEYIETKFVGGVRAGDKQIRRNDIKNETYKGGVVGEERQGVGILDNPRFHYEGGFNRNMLEGKGRIQYKTGGNSYEGDFRNGQIEGYGTFRYGNGDVYEGPMRNGVFYGKAVYKYANGDVYEGDYVDGKKEGHGKITKKDGRVWEGEFIKGKKVGGRGSVNSSIQANPDNNNKP